MKKLIFVLLLLPFLFSCQKSKELPTGVPPKIMTDSVKIKGEFKYLKTGKVTLETPGIKKSTLSSNNKFEFALELASPKYFKIKIGNYTHPIYLEPGDNIVIKNKNDKSSPSKIIFSGEGSEESNFLLQQKSIDLDQFKYREIYKLSPEDFTQKMVEFRAVHKNHYIEFLTANEKMNSEFIANEKANLDFDWAIKKLDYQRSYEMTTKQTPPKLESEYFEFMNEFDLNDEALYRNGLLRYHSMVNRYLYAYARRSSNTDRIAYLNNLFDITFEKIKSDKIKQEILGMPLNSYFADGDAVAGTEELVNRYKSLKPENSMQKYIVENYEVATRLAKGKPAPTFSFPNNQGKEISLESLRGKNICLLIWSGRIPRKENKRVTMFFDTAKKFQNNKDLSFVSLFIGYPQNRKNWLNLLDEKEYSGIILFSEKGDMTPIMTEYNIRQMQNLPRLILIDAKGNLINRNIFYSKKTPFEDMLNEVLSK